MALQLPVDRVIRDEKDSHGSTAARRRAHPEVAAPSRFQPPRSLSDGFCDHSIGVRALVSVGKAFLNRLPEFAGGVVRAVLRELDASPIGRVVLAVAQSSREYVRRAQGIAEEEAELAEKQRRDGRLRESDLERQEELAKEREELAKGYEVAKAKEAAGCPALPGG